MRMSPAMPSGGKVGNACLSKMMSARVPSARVLSPTWSGTMAGWMFLSIMLPSRSMPRTSRI